MKILRLIWCLIALLTCAATAFAQTPPDTLDLFLIGGQSNAVGAGGDSDAAWLPRADDAYWAGVRDRPSGPITRLYDVAEGHKRNSSAWPAFARRYTRQTGRRVVFLATAFGGTANVASADVGRGHWSAITEGPGGAGGPNRLDMARAELSNLFASIPDGVVVRATGVLWIQGETDANQINNGVTTRGAYFNELTATAGALRAALAPYREPGAPLAPMFVARIGYRLPDDTRGYQMVRAAQDKAAADGAFTMACKHGVLFAEMSGYMSDHSHWSQDALNHTGHHMAGAAVRDVVSSTYVIGSPTAEAAALAALSLPVAAPQRPFPNPAARGHTVRGLPPTSAVFDVLGRRVATTTENGSLVVDLRPGVYLVNGNRLTVR